MGCRHRLHEMAQTDAWSPAPPYENRWTCFKLRRVVSELSCGTRSVLHELRKFLFQTLELRQVVIHDIWIGWMAIQEVLMVGLGLIEPLERPDRRDKPPPEYLSCPELLNVGDGNL